MSGQPPSENEDSTVSELAKQYLAVLRSASSYSAAWIRPSDDGDDNNFTLTVSRACRDIDENSMRSFVETHSISSSLKSVHHNTVAVNKPVIFDLSPTSAVSISFFNTPINSKPGSTGSYVEVNHPVYGMYRIDTSGSHGKVIGDTWFGGLSWSHDERYVAYVAQIKANPNRGKTAVEAVDTFTGAIDSTKVDFTSSSLNGSDEKYMSSKFDYLEDWGEKYVEVSDLGIFVLDILQGHVTQLPGVDTSRVTIGQPQFVSPSVQCEDGTVQRNGYHIAYTAWSIQPRRLGMIYCYQRPCQILLSQDLTSLFNSKNDEKEKEAAKDVKHWVISRNLTLARSARASPFDGNTFVFLGNEKGFLSHNGCVSLYKIDINEVIQSSDESHHWKEVIPVVEIPGVDATATAGMDTFDISTMEFPGIFCDQLPRYCFLTTDRVAFTSSWGGRDALLVASLSATDGKVHEVLHFLTTSPCKNSTPSMQILDLITTSKGGNRMICSYSTPVIPFQLISFTIEWCTTGHNFRAQDAVSITQRGLSSLTPRYNVSSKLAVPNSLTTNAIEGIAWRYFEHRDEQSTIPFGSFILYPTTTTTYELPVILVPHGGPHSVTPTSFVASYYYLCKVLNAVIVHVNYRGSTGFGQLCVTSLIHGNCGRQDVDDMMYALQHVTSLYINTTTNQLTTTAIGESIVKLVNTTQVAVVGGSHGGFLGAHLCGQYPDVFKACALRNPVTNITAMTTVTDIPDWCHVETLPVNHVPSLYPAAPPTPEQLAMMYAASPVAYLHQYKTPTLVCLGAKDRRVPQSQGIDFYHMLRQKNVPTR